MTQRLRAEHATLAARWLDRLAQLIPVDAMEVFPTESLLDHIPDLIREIATFVETPDLQPMSANTSVLLKARELGALRHSQRATVHQILREYRLLNGVLFAFVQEQANAYGLQATSAQVLAVAADLHAAVDVLREATVSRFIGCHGEDLKEQSARLQAFNRMVSHELRQPLSTLHFAVRLLEVREERAPDPERARLVALLERNVERIVSLTNHLARLSRLSDGDDTLHLQYVSMATVAREVMRQLRDMADARGVVLQVDEAGMLSSVVDVAALELALLNLVSNGIKYSDPSKTDRMVRIAAGPATPGYVVVSVTDNGLGIPASHLGAVFEQPMRAHAARDAELGIEGLGLGLVIVKDCVMTLGGAIVVDSRQGAGTTFTLKFPLRLPTSDTELV